MKVGRILPLVGLFASLLLVWSATTGVLWNADTPAAVQDARFAAAERVIFYRVAPSGTLSLSLPAGVQTLRLSTHLELPEGARYAADRQYVYGLKIRFLTPDGDPLIERPLFTRTRQSKGDPVGNLWRNEAAFTTRADVQLTDEREFIITPPAELNGGPGRLEIDFPGQQGALLVRAYGQFAPGVPPLLASRRRTLVERAEARISRATFLQWEKLPWNTQRRLMSEHWERIDAVGEPGRDFQTLAVYRTDFRLPLVEVGEERQERLPAHGDIAVNVAGPARLVVWVWNPSSGDGALGPVTLSTLSDQAVRTSAELTVTSAEPTRHFLDVPAGVHTVTLSNRGGTDLRYTVEGPAFAWLAPDALKQEVRGSQLALVPDVRRFDAYAAGPACAPVELEVPELPDAAARLLKLDARLLALDEGTGEVTVELLGNNDVSLTTSSFPVLNQPATTDRADLPFGTAGKVPCAVYSPVTLAQNVFDVTDRPSPVSEPTSARLFLVPGTRKVRIRASRPVALSLASYLAPPGGGHEEAPYADRALAGVQWKNAPWAPGYWHPVRPANHLSLADSGAALQILAQVRLASLDEAAPPSPPGEPVTLAPLGAPATRELVEDDVPEPGAKPSGLYTRLLPNQPVRLSFDAHAASRPELRLDVDDVAHLGTEVTLVVDGRPLKRFKLRTTRDRALLPPIRPGVHDIVLETSASAVQALVNRAPAPGQGVHGLRERTVYQLNEGGVRLRVRKQGLRAVTLNVIVYTQSPAPTPAARLRAVIDDGAPARSSGLLVPRLTRATREVVLPRSERSAATVVGESGTKWYAHTVFVRLGEDLAPGVHEVLLTPMGGSPLWGRFFIYGQKHGEVDVLQWNREGWDPEDAP